MAENTVIIRPREKTTHLPKEVIEDQTMRIGNQFRGGDVLQPLTAEQEKEHLYPYLGLRGDESNLYEKVKDFWINLSITVPYGGLVLDLSKNSDGKYTNPRHFFMHKLAKEHTQVANEKEQADANPNCWFYLEDIAKKKEEEYEKVQESKKASKEFALLTEDEEQVEHVLRAWGEHKVESMEPKERENLLYRKMEADPKKFLSIVNNKDVATISFIEQLIEANIIEKVGTSYIYMEDALAESQKEMVQFMKSKKNTKIVNELKARLKEATK